MNKSRVTQQVDEGTRKVNQSGSVFSTSGSCFLLISLAMVATKYQLQWNQIGNRVPCLHTRAVKVLTSVLEGLGLRRRSPLLQDTVSPPVPGGPTETC